jgi:hypothetical protein
VTAALEREGHAVERVRAVPRRQREKEEAAQPPPCMPTLAHHQPALFFKVANVQEGLIDQLTQLC